MIDNQDIRDVTLSSLREQIGITPQNIEVFDRSVMENVRFGRLEASNEEVIEVCKAVGLHDDIMKFLMGWNPSRLYLHSSSG